MKSSRDRDRVNKSNRVLARIPWFSPSPPLTRCPTPPRPSFGVTGGGMAALSHHRYTFWSAQAAPPLPAKKTSESTLPTMKEVSQYVPKISSIESESTGASDIVLPSDEVTSSHAVRSASAALPSRDGAGILPAKDSHQCDSCFKFKDSQQGGAGSGSGASGAKAVQEAVMDPSKWVLRNRETGQEVEAKAFVEALMQHTARRPAQQAWMSSTPQTGHSGGGWISRRQRNNGPIIRRPTLLPPGSGGISEGGVVQVSWHPNFPSQQPVASPPSPPSRHLTDVGSLSTSPNGRGRSSVQPLASSNSHPHVRSLSGGSVMSSGDRVFKLSKMYTAQIIPEVHAGGIRAMSFSPSGGFIATAGADQRCFVFRVLQHTESSRGMAPQAPSNAAAAAAATLSATLATLAAGEECSRRQLVDAHPPLWTARLIEEEPMRILSGHVGEVVSLSWAPNDSALLTASADGTVRCWHPLDGDECSGVYEHGGRVTSVAWDPASPPAVQRRGVEGGGRFLTGCMDGRLRLFSVGCWQAEDVMQAERAVTAVAFAPGGATFVAGFVGGNVGFYRTEGMVRELTAECRRHGIRHSASQHARNATSPVRRLSAGTGGRGGSGPKNVMSVERSRRRRRTMGPASSARPAGDAEERVTGLCFRPQGVRASNGGTTVAADRAGGWNWKSDGDQRMSSSGDGLGLGLGLGEDRTNLSDNSSQGRAPAASVQYAPASEQKTSETGNEGDGSTGVGSVADVLVSTNDSRTRVLDAGADGNVAVRVKLKGHNTDGMLGRCIVSRYSDDGELVISGSTDGHIHIWPAPDTALLSMASKRGVNRSSGRERHERAPVCAKTVAVPVALFAPDCVANGIGGESSRVIVTGDDEGYLKVFVG